jgi:uncharacterized protein (DUF58 family)
MSFLSDAVDDLRTTWRKLWHEDDLVRPLLDSDEIGELYANASKNTYGMDTSNETDSLILGDTGALAYGSGLDFDGLRQYQQSDDLRVINWRAYARTQVLHVNVYKEERRPGLFIIMDRRSGMRFGTRGILKAKAAAIAACFHAFRAFSDRKRVAACCINANADWIPYKQNLRSGQHIINAINAPCPPVSQQPNEPSINSILKEASCHVKHGDEIVIISDIHDADDTLNELLGTLTKKSNVSVYHVIDPVENELPRDTGYQIQGMHTVKSIDCASQEIRNRITAALHAHHELVEAQCKQAGVKYDRILTTDNAFPHVHK